MGMFGLFSRDGKKTRQDEQREASKKKTALRLGAINGTVCRRGSYDHLNCSPYLPCFDICPVAAAPGVLDEGQSHDDGPLQEAQPAQANHSQ